VKKALLIFTIVLLVSSQAFAGGDNQDHVYAGGSIAWQYLMDAELGSNDALTDAVLKAEDAKFEFDGLGFGATGIVGYKWANGLRLEGELSHFKSKIDQVTADVGNTKLNGSLGMTAVMVNALWEFEEKKNFFPYLGLGAGYGWARGNFEGGGDRVSGTSNIPLLQPIIGMGYQLTEKVSMTMDYKFVMGLKKLDYDELEHKYRAHRVGLGLIYNF